MSREELVELVDSLSSRPVQLPADYECSRYLEWTRVVMFRAAHKCEVCGREDNLHCHHIVPMAQGGKDKVGNGVVLCAGCHRKLHGALSTSLSTQEETYLPSRAETLELFERGGDFFRELGIAEEVIAKNMKLWRNSLDSSRVWAEKAKEREE